MCMSALTMAVPGGTHYIYQQTRDTVFESFSQKQKQIALVGDLQTQLHRPIGGNMVPVLSTPTVSVIGSHRIGPALVLCLIAL